MRQMGRRLRGLAWGVAGVVLQAQGLPAPGPLLPGEGLVICAGDAPPKAYGAVDRPSPMGALARLPWLSLLGTEWGSEEVRFRCTGGDTPFPCGGPKGHGRVDLGGALRKGCDRAFMAWIEASMDDWRHDLGGSVARMQVLEVFEPFVGRRLAPGDDLPALTPAWIGRGELLQTSPAGLARWLQDPRQMELLASLQRFGSGYFVDIKVLLGREGWWILPATAPDGGSGTRAWVLAGRGDLVVILRLPAGRGEAEGVARLRAILDVK